MNRLDSLRTITRPILTCYLPAGDPLALPSQVEIYAQQGVDVFEIGIPCSEPFFDGELVQNSMSRALATAVKQRDIAKCASRIRQQHQDKAVVMMGYQNLCLEQLLINGKAEFDGLLQVGAAKQESELEAAAIRPIVFVPHDLPEEMIALARLCSGYVMLQAASGKTGLRNEFDMSNKMKIERLRANGVVAPILLGVGISNAEQARQAIECGADGVIIGSACLAKMLEGEAQLRDFLAAIRSALNGSR